MISKTDLDRGKTHELLCTKCGEPRWMTAYAFTNLDENENIILRCSQCGHIGTHWAFYLEGWSYVCHCEACNADYFGKGPDGTCPGCGRENKKSEISRPIPPKPPQPLPNKETGKTSFSLLQFDFLTALARHMMQGLKNGRRRDDWKKLDWTPGVRREYMDALLRHTFENFDPIAIAANCMIIWYNDRRTRESTVSGKTDNLEGHQMEAPIAR